MRASNDGLPEKPDDMFDRDVEWMELAAFAGDQRPGATLGVVSGRRRQGKTFLLRALCEATRGFYFAADEATDGESLHQIGAALGAYLKLPSALRFESWHGVFDALLALGTDRPVTVVIDEFPYLARANPGLPSILQNALAPRRAEREGSRSRLLLCGSAMTFMGTLLAGNAPLRGRAGLELVVPTLDYQLAAQFWGVTDPVLAVKVHAVVGGTPAYRREFARDDTPADAGDFDAWIQRTVLNPASPLFREARYLLAAESELHDLGLYHSVLAAIAAGNTTRGAIGIYTGRKSGDLAHPLNVLMDCGLVHRRPDAFRDNQSTYEIAEPLITFYHAVMRPIWSDLAHTRVPERLWARSESRFTANVLGPHFEQLCRHWARYFAPEDIAGGFPARVETGSVNDPGNKKTRQVDVAVFGAGDDDREALLAIGEAKWHETMGLGHLERLRHTRGLLTARGRRGAAAARLLCFSGAGFSPELADEAARSGDIRLLTPADLYTGILLPRSSPWHWRRQESYYCGTVAGFRWSNGAGVSGEAGWHARRLGERAERAGAVAMGCALIPGAGTDWSPWGRADQVGGHGDPERRTGVERTLVKRAPGSPCLDDRFRGGGDSLRRAGMTRAVPGAELLVRAGYPVGLDLAGRRFFRRRHDGLHPAGVNVPGVPVAGDVRLVAERRRHGEAAAVGVTRDERDPGWPRTGDGEGDGWNHRSLGR